MTSDLQESERALRASQTAPTRRQQRETGKKRKRRVGWIWAVALTVVLIVPGMLGGYLLWLGSTFDQGVGRIGDAFPEPSTRPTQVSGVVNILLIGSDSRSGLDDVTSGKPTGQRSDTLMLVHLPADRSGIVIVSLMRDLWVPVPGHGSAKLNAAFSWGGVTLTVQTVEGLLGARIDHVMVVDFGGFGSIATALGGVDVQSDRAFTSKNMPGFRFQKGNNRVEGDAALAFVRERYSFADADFQRVRNQQTFIRGVLEGFIQSDILMNPLKTQAAIGTLAKYLAVDDQLNAGEVASLALGYRSLSAAAVHTITLPTAGTGSSPDGQSIVRVDEGRLAVLREALKNDDVIRAITRSDFTTGAR